MWQLFRINYFHSSLKLVDFHLWRSGFVPYLDIVASVEKNEMNWINYAMVERTKGKINMHHDEYKIVWVCSIILYFFRSRINNNSNRSSQNNDDRSEININNTCFACFLHNFFPTEKYENKCMS